MKYTISVHNGSKAHRDHNIRNPKVVSKEDHITKDGDFEIWKDETLVNAYHRLFDEALKEYNNKQTRSDRKIKNYLSHVRNDAKKHPVYELIVEVGSMDNRPPKDIHKQILKEFFLDWEKRNPNLELIGAYLHDDEVGNMHIHFDYISVAYNCKRGMKTQNALVKALEQQGFTKVGNQTAQIQWQDREREVLESLCNKYGLEIEHPKRERMEHLDTQEYKLTKKVEDLEVQTEQLQKENSSLREEVAILKGERKKQKDLQLERTGTNIFGVSKNKVELSYEDYRTLTRFNKMYEDIENTKTEIDNLKIKTQDNYIKSKDLVENMESKIEEEVNKKIDKAFDGCSKDKMKRMEEFIQQVKMNNGNSLYDEFTLREKEIANKIKERIKFNR